VTTQADRTVADVGERGLVRRIRDRIPAVPSVALGIGDDAALLATTPETLATMDALVEGVHFRREWAQARLLGRKAVTVNLSDIVAMGGAPAYAMASLCLPRDLSLAFLDGLYDGVLERAAEAGVHVVGGNISATGGPLVIDIAMLGRAGANTLKRSGAIEGDAVVVTGRLGAAAEGLRLLGQGARLGPEGELAATGVWTESSAASLGRCLRAQLDPSPPLAFGRSVAQEGLVRAAIDISDGLSSDLLAVCVESGLGAILEASAIPVDPHAAALERARGGDALSLALHGGEDYELLMAVAEERLEELMGLGVVWDVPLSVVGRFRAGPPGVVMRLSGGEERPLEPGGFDHFHAGSTGSGAAEPGA
jgi:thiamine-monophosphate kinase